MAFETATTDATAITLFGVFAPRATAAIWRKRATGGTYDPNSDTAGVTDTDVALSRVILLPMPQRDAEAGGYDVPMLWALMPGVDIRGSEPLGTEDVLIVGSKRYEIRAINRIPETNPALYKVAVERGPNA